MAPRDTGAHKDVNRKRPEKRPTDQKPSAGTTSAAQPNQSQSNQTRPNVDFGGMPDLSGRKEGDEWSFTRPNGEIVNYRIPQGNGNRSVDIDLVGADGGLIGTMRAAMGEGGGFQEWVDVRGGPSVYVGQDTKYSNPYAATYNSGTSTSGPPDSAKAYLPDWQQQFALIENGEVVGELGVIPSKDGYPDVYQNVYFDKFGNVSQWQNRSTESGGMTGWQQAQVDSSGHGWQILSTGTSGSPERWEISPDLPLLTRTEETSAGVHSQTFDLTTNAMTDRFTSKVSPEKGYYSFRDPRGVTTRVGEDGSVVVVGRNGDLIVDKPGRKPEYRDDRSNWEKFWDFAGNSAETFVDGTLSMLGQNSKNYGDGPKLSPNEAKKQNQEEALAGMAGLFVGLGAGLALSVIDGYEGTFGNGIRDDAAYTPTDNALGTLNVLAQFTIGVDLENYKDQPGQTISDAVLGTALFFLPKAPRAMGGGRPPHVPRGVLDGFGELGNGLDAHPIPVTPGGYIGPRSPRSTPNGFEMRNGGDGAPRSTGTPRDKPGDDRQGPSAGNTTPRDPGPPPLPAGMLDPDIPEPNGAMSPGDSPHGLDSHAIDPDAVGPGIPWFGATELTPPGHWPVGVYAGKNNRQWYRPRPGGGLPEKIPMPEWATNGGRGSSKPNPPLPEQRALERATPPNRDGMAQNHPDWNVENIDKDSNVRGFVGDALTRAKLLLQGYRIIAAGEKAKIPIPGKSGEFFKPDFIAVDRSGKLVIIESKFNESPYRADQFDGYQYYKDGGRPFEIDLAKNPDLMKELRINEVDTSDMVIDRVETVRWNNEWAPTDDVLRRAADDTKILGDLVDGTINNPEWRDSALSAFSELNAEAARRAFNSGDYLAAVHYQSRHQALELLRNVEPSPQALNESLLGAGPSPVHSAAGPLAQDISAPSDLLGALGGGTQGLSFLVNTLSAPIAPLRPRVSDVRRPLNQSLTMNISSPAGAADGLAQVEELRVMAYGAHM
ncbi:hypothetical protein ABZ540_35630 [Nocardia xishanensis]|uniref:hypothetical protein n=1 Tax=Nocardia xishanensis TaxID=238964 RepID=UPI0033F5CD15